MRCKSGDICIVVGDVSGCEENIGAFLTVTEPIDGVGWEFKDASRPLRAAPDGPMLRATSAGRPGTLYGFYDQHLVPVPTGVLAAFKKTSAVA